MIAARIVSYIVEYTAPVWHRRHVDSRPRRAIHPPISPYRRHPPRTIPLARPLNGQAESPPWCSIIDTYRSRRLARFSRAAACVSMPFSTKCTFEQSRTAEAEGEKLSGKRSRRAKALVGVQAGRLEFYNGMCGFITRETARVFISSFSCKIQRSMFSKR